MKRARRSRAPEPEALDAVSRFRARWSESRGTPGELAQACLDALGAADGAVSPMQVEDAVVEALQAARSRSVRDPLGLVLTPPWRARALVRLMGAAFPREWGRARVVLDPAAGTGRLAREAAPVGGPRRGVAWEIDPVVLEMGRLLTCGASWGCVDALEAARPECASGELAIVCHPPWRASAARGGVADERTPRGRHPALSDAGTSRRDQGSALLLRCVRDLLAPGEVGAFVVPETFLTGARLGAVRERLIELCTEMVVGRVPPSAESGCDEAAAILVCLRGEESLPLFGGDAAAPRARMRFAATDERGDWRTPSPREASRGEELLCRAGVPFARPTAAAAVARRLAGAGVPRLGELFVVRDGANPGGAEARAALLVNRPQGLRRPRPAVEGGQIRPGRLLPAVHWLETEPTAILPAWKRSGTSLRDPALFRGPRAYCRQMSPRLTAAFCDDGSVALNSVLVIRARKSAGDARAALLALVALLNTALATELYAAWTGESDSTRRVVRVSALRELRLPWPLPASVARHVAAFTRKGSVESLEALDAALRSEWDPGDGEGDRAE